MAKVTVTQIVKAPLEDVWASWDDFGNIANFNPGVKSSYLLKGSTETGIGSKRQCNMSDGKNHIREKIVEYVPQQKMVINIYEGTMPLDSAIATLMFTQAADGKTRVVMTMAFTPKFGLIGALMVPMMKSQFRKMLQGLVNSNASYVENSLTSVEAA